MLDDITSYLPILIPKAVAWANERAAAVAETGTPLTANRIAIARRVGVEHPEAIRVLMVSGIPLPDDPLLKEAAHATGMLGAGTVGLTLGHSLLICHGHDSPELIAHECRHVYQYEQYGSIEAYLPAYLGQVLEYGYFAAPLEVDARKYEHLSG